MPQESGEKNLEREKHISEGAKARMSSLGRYGEDGMWRLALAVLENLPTDDLSQEEKGQYQNYVDAFEQSFVAAKEGKTELPPGDFEETEKPISVDRLQAAIERVKGAIQ